MKNKKVFVLIVLVMLLSLVGISYAFFEYYGDVNYQVTAGEVTLTLNEGTNALSLNNIFPETPSEARERKDNFITFTVSGANTTTNKDIWYEIMLNEGDTVAGKTRFLPKELMFDLSEVNADGTETLLVDAMSYNDFNARRIWVNSIVKDTTATSSKTYKLRMWLSDNVIISDTESYADYTTSEFRNRYASVKVSVYGDFVEKKSPYNYMAKINTTYSAFWPTNIEAEKANITSVNFVEMDETEMTTRYNASTIKADVTDTSKSDAGSVLAWLETNEDDNTKYTMYVASEGISFFPSDSTCMFYKFTNLVKIKFDAINTGAVTSVSSMFAYCSGLTSLDVSGFDTGAVTSMSSMFAYCSGLTSLDVSGFDTGAVTSMGGIFLGCSGLTSLDVSGFDTGAVTSMYQMFHGCSGLTSLDVSGFDTGAVINMKFMFGDCSSLTSLDVSGFDTGAVTSMYQMFAYCSGLTSLDVSGFDTGAVTDMSIMFFGCSGLTSLDVSGFDTKAVTSMYQMFFGCSGLTSLDVSGFDTGAVTSMYQMFHGCSGLTSLDVSGFDTGAVTSMSSMFNGCSGLTSLDVSGFDTGAVTDMASMFSGCSNLVTIYSNTDWNVGSKTSTGMFSGCYKLVGAVSYDSTKTDITMANPTDGYFTTKETA